MRIGAAAAHTGLSCKAIRLYEQQGLIRPGRRGSYRHFSAADLDLLALIREARSLDVPLQRLRTAIQAAGQPGWTRLRALLVQLQQDTEQEIVRQQQRLLKMAGSLQEIGSCPLMLDSAPSGKVHTAHLRCYHQGCCYE